MRRLVAILAATAVTSPMHAAADEATQPGTADGGAPSPNRVNVRMGAATSDTVQRPVICVDVRVIRGFGVESCGTGQGVIHDEDGTEIAHFRGTWTFLESITPSGVGKLRAGVGFAELQVGVDHPGFHFNEPDRVERGSVAGPEVALQGQWLLPFGKGIEAIVSATAGLAAFAHADKLVVPKNNVQPFVSFELGVGW